MRQARRFTLLVATAAMTVASQIVGPMHAIAARSETQTYVGDGLGGGCLEDLNFSDLGGYPGPAHAGGACFHPLSTETAVAIEPHDASGFPVGGAVSFYSTLGWTIDGFFCGNVSVSIPPGTEMIEVSLLEAENIVCTERSYVPLASLQVHQPTVGTITAVFS